MPDWYYHQNGQQVGPVTIEQLRSWAAEGRLRPEDPVWNETLPTWLPAQQIPEIFGAARPMPVAYQQPTMGYNAPIQATPRAIQALADTKPWVRFVAVLMFIGCGFLLLGSIGILLASIAMSGHRREAGFMVVLFFVYVAMAVLYFFPAMYLNSMASRIGDLLHSRCPESLEKALEAQRAFWRFIGIVTIVGMALGLIFGIIAAAIA